MSGGSQHNPNGRQSQLAPGWSPLQLQVASYLARGPAAAHAHMAPERGVTWHTPTPPHHLYHMSAHHPDSPEMLQAMKVGATASNSVFRHTATPPDLYRHTPTPPDKHILRHTPSPGDVKGTSVMPPVDLYPHLGSVRDKLVRPEDMLAYARGVDLSVTRAAPAPSCPSPAPAPAPAANGAPLALSVRDAPTINSLIARVAPRPAHARVDALLERLAPSSPHSVIVHPRTHTPSPPSSNEDSADSSGPPGNKRKRKPERTVRVPVPPPAPSPPVAERLSPSPALVAAPPPAPVPVVKENGDAHVEAAQPSQPPADGPRARRKTRSGSAETIDDIAAMIASTDEPEMPEVTMSRRIADADRLADVTDVPVTIDRLESVLASPEPAKSEPEPKRSPSRVEERPSTPEAPAIETAAAPRRRSARISNSEPTNAPVDSPSEAKPAETETNAEKTVEPTSVSFVEVENQLEKMFAGIEEEAASSSADRPPEEDSATERKKGKKRKAPKTAAEKKVARLPGDRAPKKNFAEKRPKIVASDRRKSRGREHCDSGSNASSGRSRGPYIQVRGARDSPATVGAAGAAPDDEERPRGERDYRNGAKAKARGLHRSTLGARYDATTADASWVCAFCERGPHAGARERAPRPTRPLGDLFGPYALATDCEEFLALDEAERRAWRAAGGAGGAAEAWTHEECAVWAPGVLAAGARAFGLAAGVWRARARRCDGCGRRGAGVACSTRGCDAATHVGCARAAAWALDADDFRARCPHHASSVPPTNN